jgi:hypothetical protein
LCLFENTARRVGAIVDEHARLGIAARLELVAAARPGITRRGDRRQPTATRRPGDRGTENCRRRCSLPQSNRCTCARYRKRRRKFASKNGGSAVTTPRDRKSMAWSSERISVAAQLFGGDAGGRRGRDGARLCRLGHGGDDVLFEQGFEGTARNPVGARDRRRRQRRARDAIPRPRPERTR